MALRLTTVQDYDAYFARLAQSNFSVFHYLDADADVETRCVFSPVVKWLCRMLPCFRRIFSTPIETRLELISGRIQAYQRLPDKTVAGQKNIWLAAAKINDLIDRVNAKRAVRHEPLIPEIKRFQDLLFRSIWDKANVRAKAAAGDPEAKVLLSASLLRSSESSALSSSSTGSSAAGIPPLFGSQLGNFRFGGSRA